MKKLSDVVCLKNNRTNLCIDPLNEYANFKMRERSSFNKGHPVHKSYDEIMDLLGEFDKNIGDVDDRSKASSRLRFSYKTWKAVLKKALI